MICFFSVSIWTCCSEKMGSLVKGVKEPEKRRSVSEFEDKVAKNLFLIGNVVWRGVVLWIKPEGYTIDIIANVTFLSFVIKTIWHKLIVGVREDGVSYRSVAIDIEAKDAEV